MKSEKPSGQYPYSSERKVDRLQLDVMKPESVTEPEYRLTQPDIRLRLAAHDLRTPLQAIRLHADALALRIQQPEVPKYHSWLKSVESIRNCVGEMACMIDRLSDQHPHEIRHDTSEILQTTKEVIRVCPDASEFPLHIPENLPSVNLCREDLFQIIQNLVTNSVRHGGKCIRIDGTESGGYVDIHYADDGPGIPELIFMQCEGHVPPLTRNRHGAGLWLISRMLEAKGGKILRSRHHHQDGICIRLPK